MNPEISVIIPTYNRASVLERAVSSVLGQSFEALELIIVDDGSTDQTQDIIQGLRDSRVKTLTTENRGVSAARNFAVKESQASWISFLDSDDEWLPNKLEDQWRIRSGYSLIHGEEIWVRNGIRVNAMNKHKKSGGDVFKQATQLCCISPSTVLLKKELFNKVGGFREDFPVCEDYDLWLKITSQEMVGFVEKPIIKKYGGHEDQLSRKFRAMDYWRILALEDILKTNLTPEKRQMALNELIKKCRILLKGYRKHGNLSQYDQIFNLYKRALRLKFECEESLSHDEDD